MANYVEPNEVWEQRYARGEIDTRYPFDLVIGFLYRTFPESLRSQTKILDFGCGIGNHLQFLIESGFDTYGADTSSSAVSKARILMKEVFPSYSPENIRNNEVDLLPFEDGMFDAIIDRSSLGQNKSTHIKSLVAEMDRVLKPGGVYFGINFSDHHPELYLGDDLGSGDFGFFSKGKFQGIGQRHFFSVAEIRDLFSRFKIDDIRTLQNRSLFGKSGSEELIVVASKYT